MENITATYIEGHFNFNANCFIPGYWTPDNVPFRWPCETEEEAIEAGRSFENDETPYAVTDFGIN